MSILTYIGLICALIIIARDVIDTIVRVKTSEVPVKYVLLWLVPPFFATAAIVRVLT